jgi:hypothetical protein
VSRRLPELILTCVPEFSDMEYPTNSSYIDEYIAEASYQVVNKDWTHDIRSGN